MPELPEVETVVRTLEKQIKNCEICKVEVSYEKIITYPLVSQFKKSLINQHFRKFKRRGKYLIFGLDDYNLIVHLRMEGKFFLLTTKSIEDPHVHVVFHLSDGTSLAYQDVRKFGKMYLYGKNEEISCLRGLGKEFFDIDMTVDYLASICSKRKMPLKQLLLDQHLILGVGNIYADEICFRVKKHPRVPCDQLNREDYQKLIEEGKLVLSAAIKAGGTTIRSYTSSLGISGRFQQSLLVHGRENEACPVCGTIILKDKVVGRGTYYCPNCQPYVYRLVGLTGRRAAGKSTVLNIFREAGFVVGDADMIVDSLLRNKEVLQAIEPILGLQLDKTHRENKRIIATKIFSDDKLKEDYLAYLYPLVKDKVLATQGSYRIIEVQRLFEAGWQPYFDASIAVIAQEKVTGQRLLDKGLKAEEINERAKFQAKNSWLISKANFIIYNDDDLISLRKEVERLIKILKGEKLC